MNLTEQYEKLLRYCCMKTKNNYAAEDIVQETFLRFWQSHSYAEMGKESAYLYTIARNLCMDYFREKRTLNIEEQTDVAAEKESEPENILNSIAIEEALEQLPEDIREIILMRFSSELSAADIAKIMGMSRFSVNRRLKEGLKRLKSILEEGERS